MSAHSTASFHAREAADCLSVAERVSDEFTMHSYHAVAIAHLTRAAGALGYDMIKRQPAVIRDQHAALACLTQEAK